MFGNCCCGGCAFRILSAQLARPGYGILAEYVNPPTAPLEFTTYDGDAAEALSARRYLRWDFNLKFTSVQTTNPSGTRTTTVIGYKFIDKYTGAETVTYTTLTSVPNDYLAVDKAALESAVGGNPAVDPFYIYTSRTASNIAWSHDDTLGMPVNPGDVQTMEISNVLSDPYSLSAFQADCHALLALPWPATAELKTTDDLDPGTPIDLVALGTAGRPGLDGVPDNHWGKVYRTGAGEYRFILFGLTSIIPAAFWNTGLGIQGYLTSCNPDVLSPGQYHWDPFVQSETDARSFMTKTRLYAASAQIGKPLCAAHYLVRTDDRAGDVWNVVKASNTPIAQTLDYNGRAKWDIEAGGALQAEAGSLVNHFRAGTNGPPGSPLPPGTDGEFCSFICRIFSHVLSDGVSSGGIPPGVSNPLGNWTGHGVGDGERTVWVNSFQCLKNTAP